MGRQDLEHMFQVSYDSNPELINHSMHVMIGLTACNLTKYVELLLDRGYPIDGYPEATPLFTACQFGLPLLMVRLLTRGADPNKPVGGVPPLLSAVAADNAPAVRALMQFHARTNIVDPNGLGPLDQCRSAQVVELLCQADCAPRPTTLHYLIEKSTPEVVKEVLARCPQINLNALDSQSRTPLHVACELSRGRARIDIVNLLIDSGARFDVIGGSHKLLPIHYMSYYAHDNLLPLFQRFLVEKKLALNVCHEPLLAHVCQYYLAADKPEVIDLLIKVGADVNQPSLKGVTPLGAINGRSSYGDQEKRLDEACRRVLIAAGARSSGCCTIC